MGQQMTHFGGGQSDEWRFRRRCWRVCGRRKRRSLLHTDADQEGRGEQDQRDMAIPAEVTADFIVIESKIFGGF